MTTTAVTTPASPESTPEPARVSEVDSGNGAISRRRGSAEFVAALDPLAALRPPTADSARVTSDEHGILIAYAVALRADCTRRRVGAVIVDAFGRVIGTGRNGAPPGRPGCLSQGACPRGQQSVSRVAPGSSYSAGAGACIAVHAEVNACFFSDPHARRGGTVYITDPPCGDCAKHLVAAGLARAVWPMRADQRATDLGAFIDQNDPDARAEGWDLVEIDLATAPILNQHAILNG